MSSEHLSGTEGMASATDAFRDAMDAESPARSKRAPREEREQSRQDIEEIFPNRNMDRRETEGGADDEPEVVRKRRDELRARNAGEVDADPRNPNEGTDEDDEDEPEDDDEQPEQPPVEDEEDEGDDEEPVAGEIDENQIVRVMVDGQPVEVSIGEMSRGYIRQETFHRRMGELSQGVQALHAAKQTLDGKHADFVQRSEALEAYVTAFMPTEPDWDALFKADPQQFTYLKHQWDKFQTQLGGLVQHREAIQAQRAAAEVERIQQFAAANRMQLAKDFPEWKSEKVWKRDTDSMRRTAKADGYSDGELAQLYDARAVRILLKASKYDRLMANKPRPVRQQPNVPTKRNGATPQRGNVSRTFDRAEKRLSRTGSLTDAARVFEGILDREG